MPSSRFAGPKHKAGTPYVCKSKRRPAGPNFWLIPEMQVVQWWNFVYIGVKFHDERCEPYEEYVFTYRYDRDYLIDQFHFTRTHIMYNFAPPTIIIFQAKGRSRPRPFHRTYVHVHNYGSTRHPTWGSITRTATIKIYPTFPAP